MKNQDNLLGVLKSIFRWRKAIFIICFIVAVGSSIISLLLPVYFKSTTIFLAASPDIASPELMFGDGASRTNYYGNENDIDRLLTIAESSELIEFLIDTFDLYKHYDIDSSNLKAPYKIRLAFLDLFEVKKTKRDAIQLSVEDKDRFLCAEIANTARNKIDEMTQKLLKNNLSKRIITIKNNIKVEEDRLMVLADSLSSFREKYGIYNSNAQSETLTEQIASSEASLIREKTRFGILEKSQSVDRDTILYLSAMVQGKQEEVNQIRDKLEKFNAGLSVLNFNEKEYFETNQSLSEDREKLKQYEAVFEAKFPATIIIESGRAPVIKSRPRRSILVLAATAITFFLSIIGVLILETYKDINWREIVYAK